MLKQVLQIRTTALRLVIVYKHVLFFLLCMCLKLLYFSQKGILTSLNITKTFFTSFIPFNTSYVHNYGLLTLIYNIQKYDDLQQVL